MGCTGTQQAKNKDEKKYDKSSRYAKTDSIRYRMQDYPAVRMRYKLIEVIGHGNFGVVYKAESKQDPSMQVAIKVLKKGLKFDRKSLQTEINILNKLDHPNIVKYYQGFEDSFYYFVVTEFCSGGDLFDRISQKHLFGETEAAAITKKLLCALNHCHTNKIAHRDIKPENILYSTDDEKAEVKLIDFGLAKKAEPNLETYSTKVGSPYYVAPEVFDGNYSNECDIWSLGVVLHIMLSGFMPFYSENNEELFNIIRKGELNFRNPVWLKVTPPAIDLLRKMLDTNNLLRITAAKALNHEWFKKVKEYTPELDELDATIMNSMKKYQSNTKFQKAIMQIVVKTLKEPEINELVKIFNELDKDRTGYIQLQVMIDIFKKHYPSANIQSLLSKFALENNKVINYSQFIASTLDTQKFLTTERLSALFHYFDVADNGYLTAEDIRSVLNNTGNKQYTITEVNDMLKEHKIRDTNCIKFKEFSDIMNKLNIDPEEDVIQSVISK